MRSVFGALGRGIFSMWRMFAYGGRMALWTVLTNLRGVVRLVCGFTTIAGWVGGVVMIPAFLAYSNATQGTDFGWEPFALFIGVGLAMGLIAPLVSVKYDSLLFWLEPKDRITIYG